MQSEQDAKPISLNAERISKQLERRLHRHDSSGEAFVISVYGEWGIGKTKCLKDVQRYFEDKLKRLVEPDSDLPLLADSELVVPVFFDPWQFEHEEHLVVPLLKTIELAMEKLAEQMDDSLKSQRRLLSFLDRAKRSRASVFNKATSKLRQGGQVLGNVAISLLSGFKFKFSPLKEIVGLDIDFAPKDIFDSYAKRADLEKPAKSVPFFHRFFKSSKSIAAFTRAAERESLYFDVRTALEGVTASGESSENSAPSLRFVVLVDDLDRCLPEKAIQMLESIKLFLNAPGFSFVLAVDDEVVERGIAYRYRNYLSEQSGQDSRNQDPISGAEYLEKIIHLPVLLSRWTEAEARNFIRQLSPTLFPDSKEGKDEAADNAGAQRNVSRSKVSSTDSKNEGEALLELIVKAIPLVPRKLIRLVEGVEFMQQAFQENGASRYWSAPHACRTVALQQLYPALYRHVRGRPGRYWRLFEHGRDAFSDPVSEHGESLKALREQYETRANSAGSGGTVQTQQDSDSLQERLQMLELIEVSRHQRGSHDPLSLFGVQPGVTKEQRAESAKAYETLELNLHDFSHLYFHLQFLGIKDVARSVAPAERGRSSKVATRIGNEAVLLGALLNPDTLNRREALQANPLDGHVPDALFTKLRSNFNELDEVRQSFLIQDEEWLRDLASISSPEQLLSFYQEARILERLLPDAPRSGD